ncbi:hypothetical protein BCR44DRAFT_1492316 [Catenaria anguillulae PL171]|uniref:Phospholipid-transporting ATPase n=1 Tax=Catenaria anguillulae PL171 TaxID=765915 RepID=A0A1Y2I3H3_9FUNG|nr:hypothetical protein BCR44DRAFT_1492316 [Catenaria anguillulae PL171]
MGLETLGRRRLSAAIPKSGTTERHIYVNTPLPEDALDANGRPSMTYPSNEVVTSKYSLLSFLPKNLFEQFRRLANVFFLLLIILQTFPEFITVDPMVAAAPTIIIVAVTAMKDGFEDMKRHNTDNQVNNRITYSLPRWGNVNYVSPTTQKRWAVYYWIRRVVLGKKGDEVPESRGGNDKEGLEKTEVATSLGNLSIRDPCALEDAWSPVKWRDLRVGDYVLLRNNEFIPADVVIVSTSEPDSVCYVETKNLDGETNLKVRKGMAETAHIRTPSNAPSNNMFTFNGAVTITDLGSVTDLSDRMPCKIPITMNGVLLRGCVLRNTSWVIGLVVYTGNQTKLRLNAGETPSKRSIIERLMNPQLSSTLGGIFWSRNAVKVRAPYLPLGSESGYDVGYASFLAFWSALIAFQNIVPISLYLTVEIVKTLQAYLIYSDIQMYYEHLDLPCVPKSWNLADDLGQIEYVFSDKTGTLTRNVMEFRRCSINGVVYGAPLLTSQSPTKSAAAAAQFTPPADFTPRSLYGSPTPKFYDALMYQDLDVDNEHARMVCEFWRLIGICHTVLVSKPDPAQPYHITYKAQSPDEAALVEASKELGFTFIGRHMTDIFMDVMGVEEQYTLLAVLEFNSTRKRMSIVARRPDGAIRLGSNTSQLVQECTLKHLELFADEGLRTLCLAYRVIPTDEFYEWVADYNEACAAIHDREDKIDATAERIERDLVLLGATAIEDQLQEGVPECIQTLRDAGIKVWVLTGDKMETAISIGFSCNLLAKNLNLIVIKGGPEDPAAVMNQIKEAISTFFTNRAAAAGANGEAVIGCNEHALVIDGAALKVALEANNKAELLSLGSRCKVVICCRVSPLQKAQVVSLVKDGLNAVTLAIGDGANDVSMIQAAHIGIGIAGEEGLQAVMASDYAIAQFRYLSRLLLVHGRWSYHRISELIYNYFYKDIIFVFVIFWFQFYAGYSTQAPYEFTYMLFYNLFFTNWPVMVLGIFDQDVPESMAAQVPKLYQSGIKQTLYTKSRFWLYMFDGVYQSLVCYFIPMGIYYECQSTGHLGYAPDIYELGTTMAAASITCANLYVALNTKRWIWFNHVATWVASIGVFYAYLVVFFNVDSPVQGLGAILWSSPLFWFGTLLSVTVSMLPRYLYEYAKRTYMPTDVDIANEQQPEQQHQQWLDDRLFFTTPPFHVHDFKCSSVSKAIRIAVWIQVGLWRTWTIRCTSPNLRSILLHSGSRTSFPPPVASHNRYDRVWSSPTATFLCCRCSHDQPHLERQLHHTALGRRPRAPPLHHPLGYLQPASRHHRHKLWFAHGLIQQSHQTVRGAHHSDAIHDRDAQSRVFVFD